MESFIEFFNKNNPTYTKYSNQLGFNLIMDSLKLMKLLIFSPKSVKFYYESS